MAQINGQIAQDIVNFRVANGPFKTLFDLNRVVVRGTATSVGPDTALQYLNGSPQPGGPDFDAIAGDFTPSFPTSPATTDGIKNDTKERFATVTRLSNLLIYSFRQRSPSIFRSRDGDGNEMVVQRRLAFIVDRSGLPSTGLSVCKDKCSNRLIQR